jgi:hypothetical protein
MTAHIAEKFCAIAAECEGAVVISGRQELMVALKAVVISQQAVPTHTHDGGYRARRCLGKWLSRNGRVENDLRHNSDAELCRESLIENRSNGWPIERRAHRECGAAWGS